MTLCGVDIMHKFLAYKSAFALCYKLNNFITAAHFARLVVDLEPSGIFESKPEMLQQYSKYYQACQKKGTNAKQLKFQPQDSEQTKEINDGYLCLGTLDRLQDNRSTATLRCPLCGSIHDKAKFNNQLCQTCQLCRLGKDSLGLNIVIDSDETSKADIKLAGELKLEIDSSMPSFL